MAKNLVLDLEHVLIYDIQWRILHPQAREVLKRSNTDFDKTYLWTFQNLKLSLAILDYYSLLKYFDGIMGVEITRVRKKTYDTLLLFDDGRQIDKVRFPTYEQKYLSLLGNPKDFVLIEDEPSFGWPKERVVEIAKFNGEQNHDLLSAYEMALRKFD